jgi:hypothetical protein
MNGRIRYAEFLVEFARITDTFGDRTYPTERIKAIWDELRDLALPEVSSVFTNLIADPPMGRPPMRDAFRTLAQSYRGGRGDQYAELPACSWCGRLGVVMAELSQGPFARFKYQYAFRCPFCPAAQERRVSRRVPVWSRDRVPTYWPRYASGEYVGIDDVDVGPRAIDLVPTAPIAPAIKAIPISELARMSTRKMPTPAIRPVPPETPEPTQGDQ